MRKTRRSTPSPRHRGCRRAPAGLPGPCLDTREAAAFLHLNEKKLYELAKNGELPAARVGGKWLFPRALLEEWLLEQAHGGALTDRLLITGSDDPLLSATVAALAPALGAEAFVAYSPTGTLAGLELLARRRANVCALHWGGVEHSVQQHAMLLRRFGPHRKWALVRLALREQGVILRRGLQVDGIETLAAFDYRWAMRQPGAGSAHFLESALASRGFSAADCSAVATAHTEREAAAAGRARGRRLRARHARRGRGVRAGLPAPGLGGLRPRAAARDPLPPPVPGPARCLRQPVGPRTSPSAWAATTCRRWARSSAWTEPPPQAAPGARSDDALASGASGHGPPLARPAGPIRGGFPYATVSSDARRFPRMRAGSSDTAFPARASDARRFP